MSENISELQISSWINDALKNEDIKNFTSNYSGSSHKSEGYTTDVSFVTIKGIKKSNEENVEIDLVLKVSKVFKALDQKDLQEIYQKELLVYNKVFPEFQKFEQKKNIKNIFKSMAKCYATLSNGRDIIILQNLRKEGYIEYDRLIPMNIQHMKMVLEKYAKFHAISFAFKDQYKDEFEKLFGNYTNVLSKAILETGWCNIFQPKATKTWNSIKQVDEKLAANIKELLDEGIINILRRLLTDCPKEAVITHGDCWSSNFLFKYENGNRECPQEVAILDWQLSSYGSPVWDLSYFMFAVSSKEQVSNFDRLLQYYHLHLSNYISELGSNPENLFPFSTFLEQWKKYSVVGYIFQITFIENLLCDKNDALRLDDFEHEADLVQAMVNVPAQNHDLYLERVLSASKYYFDLIGK